MALRYRSTEKDILDYLSSQGFDQTSTTLRDVELVGIKHPGWLQVFTFTVSTYDDEVRNTLFGVLRDDQRATSEFFLLETEAEQRQVVERLTDGLVTRNRRPVSNGIRVALIAFGLLMTCLGFVAVTRDVPASQQSSAEQRTYSGRYSLDRSTPVDESSADARAQTTLEDDGE